VCARDVCQLCMDVTRTLRGVLPGRAVAVKQSAVACHRDQTNKCLQREPNLRKSERKENVLTGMKRERTASVV
jgi:hypothetical protein